MTDSPLTPEFIEATNALLYDLQDDGIDSAPLPDRVFHYTDAGGLIGILSSGTLWGTDFRYLNDSSELGYAFNFAERIVRQEYLGRYRSGVEAAFLASAAGDPPAIYTTSTPYYLTCFTELGNSLSQWRAYSRVQGYALEFPGDISTMAGYEPEGRQNPGLTLLRVEYDADIQGAYIRGLIERLLGICDADHLRDHPEPGTAVRSFMPFYWAQLERVSYRFKYPDFAVEREWRLVSWGEVHDEKYRTAAIGIVPYIERTLHAKRHSAYGNGLPITSVRSGPTPNQREARYALERVLSRHGYPPAVCQRLSSSTPVRL